MKKKLNSKHESGITLIALIITIIVLLILAGVAIVTLTGDNGILGKASNAKRSGVVCKSGGGGFGCNLVREKMEGKGRTWG